MYPILEKILSSPIVPTVYPLSTDILCSYVRVLNEEGYPILEVLARPLDRALKVMEEINRRPERKIIALGMGTILTEKAARQAVRLKPDFLVSPAFSRRVLQVAVKPGIPYIPAVHTFQDVQDVLEAFEDEGLPLKVLKLCPVEGLTHAYVRGLAGCYPGITFCPSPFGEVTVEDFSYWKEISCIGPVMGSRFVPQDLLERREFEAVRDRLRTIRNLNGRGYTPSPT